MSLPLQWLPSLVCASCSKRIMSMSQPSRVFSTTQRLSRHVRMRREMFQWLNRVGKNLRSPLRDSTNYLGAYNINGTLKRVAERTAKHTSEVERIRALARESPEKEMQLEEELNKLQIEHDTASKTLPTASRRDMMPFPANKDFVSEPVLGPWLQNQIWEDVMVHKMTVRQVSAQRGVEMSRVAAVVRLLQVEQEWKEQGKELANKYTENVMEMLPYTGKRALINWSDEDEKTLDDVRFEIRRDAQREIDERAEENDRRKAAKLPLLPPVNPIIPDDLELKRRIIENRRRAPHESINDLPILKVTGPQLWLPVSESRRFTRADAANAFDENLQPADKRVPHPELTTIHKEWLAGKSVEERTKLQELRAERGRKNNAKRSKKKASEKSLIKTITNKRGVIFRFQEIKVDDIGRNGRGIKGVGWRYGVPNTARSRGDVKIPQHALTPPRHIPVPMYKNLQRN